MPELAIPVMAGMAALITLITLPNKILAFIWGALLPVYGVIGVGTTAFDVARVLCATALILRVKSDPDTKPLNRWAIPICLLGLLIAFEGTITGSEHATGGLIMILSVLLAYGIAQRSRIFTPVVVGFGTGCCVSAVVLFMQVLSLPTIGAFQPSLGRYSGLSSGTPRASAELALAAIILFVWARGVPGARRMSHAALAGGLLCTAALFASGGRTGLAGVAVAIVIAARHRIVRTKHVLALATGVGVIFYLAKRYAVPLSSIDRLFGDQSGSAEPYDITTGREDIFKESLAEYLHHPILGVGYQAYADANGIAPHFAPLNFAITCGISGAVIGMYLLFNLVRSAIRPINGATNPLRAVAPLIFAVMIAMTALEPDGPFVGLGLMTLMLIAVRSVSTPTIQVDDIAMQTKVAPVR